jgi:hypothetical protein
MSFNRSMNFCLLSANLSFPGACCSEETRKPLGVVAALFPKYLYRLKPEQEGCRGRFSPIIYGDTNLHKPAPNKGKKRAKVGCIFELNCQGNSGNIKSGCIGMIGLSW